MLTAPAVVLFNKFCLSLSPSWRCYLLFLLFLYIFCQFFFKHFFFAFSLVALEMYLALLNIIYFCETITIAKPPITNLQILAFIFKCDFV